MQIITYTDNLVPLGELNGGDVFRQGSAYFIKVNLPADSNGMYKAVNLATGTDVLISKKESVVKVDAVLQCSTS